MWPATTWDDSDWDGVCARGWTVMGRTRAKQRALRQAKVEARRRIADDEGSMQLMTPAVVERQYRDRLTAGWNGSFTVLAFMFAMPDEPTIEMLNRRGEYFDIRSGNSWDLFFPGYYRSSNGQLEAHVMNTTPVGDRYARDWYFNSSDFDMLRQHVEDSSDGRWRFTGGSDLVLINAFVPERGEPTVDWESIQSGAIRPPETLAGVVERISGDLERHTEDSAYGVASITSSGRSPASKGGGPAQDFFIQALAGIATALGLKSMGM